MSTRLSRQPLITEKNAAKQLGVSSEILRKWLELGVPGQGKISQRIPIMKETDVFGDCVYLFRQEDIDMLLAKERNGINLRTPKPSHEWEQPIPIPHIERLRNTARLNGRVFSLS